MFENALHRKRVELKEKKVKISWRISHKEALHKL
jgi:hypothetical protein